nr:MAG TPA: hypothetical protein [Caudoviricetes sp.]
MSYPHQHTKTLENFRRFFFRLILSNTINQSQ